MNITIDASVLISATKPKEIFHGDCFKLLQLIQKQLNNHQVTIYEPPEILLELYSIFKRQPKTNFDFNKLKFLNPNNPLELKILQVREPELSPLIGLFNRINIPIFVKRGADLIYLWTSWISKSLLITADSGLLKYSDYNFQVINPANYSKKYGT